MIKKEEKNRKKSDIYVFDLACKIKNKKKNFFFVIAHYLNEISTRRRKKKYPPKLPKTLNPLFTLLLYLKPKSFFSWIAVDVLRTEIKIMMMIWLTAKQTDKIFLFSYRFYFRSKKKIY